MYNKKLLAEMVLKSRPKSWTNAELVNEIIERMDLREKDWAQWPILDKELNEFKEWFKKETGMSIEGWIE